MKKLSRPRLRLRFTALMLIGLVGVPAVADARPRLLVANDAVQGKQMVASIDAANAGQCSIVVVNPRGLQHTVKLPKHPRRAFAVRAVVRSHARSGDYEFSVRCGRAKSAVTKIRVVGTRKPVGQRLLTKVRVQKYAVPPRNLSLSRGNQNGSAGPTIDPVALDGLGSAEGDRGRGAIEWALAQQGRTDYNFWCLKFVAHAFGAQSAGYWSAQAAANALRPRDAHLSPSAAPPGALMFFHYRGKDGVSYGHVGISLGGGQMVHAVQTVRVENAAAVSWLRNSYLGWAFAPTSWPGRPASPAPTLPSAPSPAAPTPATTSPAKPVTPSAPTRRVITVDNRVTNGMGMREDPTPVRLTTQPWIRCGSRGCNIVGTERSSGGTFDAAVCQRTGERTTNGDDTSPADDANPLRFESTRYYGVRLANGTFGYVSEVWIRAADRGGLGLPSC